MRILSTLVMLIGALVVIVGTDLRLFGIAVLFIPLMLLGTMVLSRSFVQLSGKSANSTLKCRGRLPSWFLPRVYCRHLDAITGAEERLRSRNEIYRRFTTRLMFLEYGMWHGLGLVEIFMTVVALWMGVGWIAAGTMTAGTLVMFAQYAAMIYWPVIELSEQLGEIQRAGGAGRSHLPAPGYHAHGVGTRETAAVPQNPGVIRFEKSGLPTPPGSWC